jgi:hypothetical protein
MKNRETPEFANPPIFRSALAVTLLLFGLTQAQIALGDDDNVDIQPGNLLVSRVVYDNNPINIVAGVTLLPPNCVGSACVKATASGAYPGVWNNALVDGSFGITSKIVLDQPTQSGRLVSSLEVPNSSQPRITPNSDQMVGSFSSKSEVALNLSTDNRFVTFMGYLAPIDALDVSNSNTPAVVDPTNPVSASYYRGVAQVNQHGKFQFTKTNAFSGNNGRAAILNNNRSVSLFYTSGNAATARILSPTALSSVQVRKSSPQTCRLAPKWTPAFRHRSAVSTSHNWVTRQTRSARIPTSGSHDLQ